MRCATVVTAVAIACGAVRGERRCARGVHHHLGASSRPSRRSLWAAGKTSGSGSEMQGALSEQLPEARRSTRIAPSPERQRAALRGQGGPRGALRCLGHCGKHSLFVAVHVLGASERGMSNEHEMAMLFARCHKLPDRLLVLGRVPNAAWASGLGVKHP